MKESDVARILRNIARVAGLSHYTWHAHLVETEEKLENGSVAAAAVVVNGLQADVAIHPPFMTDIAQKDRPMVLCHEVAHVIMNDLSEAAVALAGKNAEALKGPEERACDIVAKMLVRLCKQAGVDFTALSD